MANLVLLSKTTSSLKVYIENLDLTYWGNYGTNNLPRHTQYTITIDGTTKIVSKDSNNAGETTTATFTGLEAGTTYNVTATIYYYTTDGTNMSTTLSSSFTTEANSGRPSNFSWDTAKTSGNSFNVTASEWNRLIDKVKAFHIYVNGDYNESLYPMTKVSKGDTFLASYFNQVRFAIGSLASTGMSNKSKGDTIYASDLNKIVSCLNSID